MDASLVIFAIQAGIQLGRKLNDVLVDETRERALILPLGNLYANVTENDALDYFREHPELISDTGPYAGLSREEKANAYRTILALEDRLGDKGGMAGEAREIVVNLRKFEQLKEGYGARPALQRVLGEVVEIAIDYFIAQPELLKGDTNSRKILAAFIANLDTIEFAEGTPPGIVSGVLLASLKTLNANISLVDDDLRLQTLVGGVTKSLIEDYGTLASQGDQVRRVHLLRRIASSILRGGAAAFFERGDLFLRKDTAAEKLVGATLSSVVTGISGKEDLFTNESVELIFKSALHAAADNTDIFSNQEIFQEFIHKTLTAVTDDQGREVFSDDMVAIVLQSALETVSTHVNSLIDADNPQKQLLADTVRGLVASLAADLGGGQKVKDLFSRRQLLELTNIVFREVAQYPEQLLGEGPADDLRTPLAQIVRSVAMALADAPEKLLSGEGRIEIMENAIRVSAQNLDKLLDVNTIDPKQNLLYQAIKQAVSAILEGGDSRGLISRSVFPEIIGRILPVVSANIEALVPQGSQQIAETIKLVLALSTGALESRINSANLPVLMEKLLVSALWSELNIQDNAAIEMAALRILREAV